MALYDLASDYDWQRFIKRANSLRRKKALAELVDSSKRSVRQNNYLHLAIGIFAMEVGETLERTKQMYFKTDCNPDIFLHRVYDKVLDREIDDVRSTRDLSREEMGTCIDRWIKWCSERGVVIPEPDDEAAMRQAAVMVDNVKRFL